MGAIVRRYKSGWHIKRDKKGNYYLYKDGERINCTIEKIANLYTGVLPTNKSSP